MKRMLIADDHRRITSILEEHAKNEGYMPVIAFDGNEAMHKFETEKPDVTVGAYNHRDDSLYTHSGRGPSRTGAIRPDLVARGVDIKAPWPNSGYSVLSGTSIASAIITGSASLLSMCQV